MDKKQWLNLDHLTRVQNKNHPSGHKQRLKVSDLTRMQIPVWYSDQHGDLAGRCVNGGSVEVDGGGGRGGHCCA